MGNKRILFLVFIIETYFTKILENAKNKAVPEQSTFNTAVFIKKHEQFVFNTHICIFASNQGNDCNFVTVWMEWVSLSYFLEWNYTDRQKEKCERD